MNNSQSKKSNTTKLSSFDRKLIVIAVLLGLIFVGLFACLLFAGK